MLRNILRIPVKNAKFAHNKPPITQWNYLDRNTECMTIQEAFQEKSPYQPVNLPLYSLNTRLDQEKYEETELENDMINFGTSIGFNLEKYN